MSEWKEYKLGDIATYVNRGIAPKYVVNDGIPVINQKCIRSGNISNEFLKYHNKEKNHSPEKKLIEGDILINSTGVGTAGRVGLFLLNDYTLADSHVSILRLNKREAVPQYVFYNLRNREDELENTAEGSTGQIELKRDGIKDLDILLPPLPEQRAIASVLSSLDDKIDLLHRQNTTLEAMAETLFRQWFVEEAEEEWEEGKLGDYINVKHGYAFKGKFITTGKNNQILVTPGNFKIGGGFKVGKMKYFMESDYPKDYIFSSDDLIVTMTDLSNDGDTLGYSALIPEHNQDEVLYLHNQRVGKVEFKKNVNKYFFYYLMKTDDYQLFILGGASGTSIRHTSPTSICSYPFKVPPMKRIEEFDAVVSELISKVHKNQNQIRTLEKLRDTLLPKLMSGEVRIEIGGIKYEN
ncbi:MAG: restriction endonuclease subunit S [Desulfobacterales bacterium]|nr:restriction endonuclease subunit S [Desulfobacterales bacterium]